MPGLEARFLPDEGGEGLAKVPSHQFNAALREYARGQATRTQIETTITSAWSLAGQEVTDLGAILDLIDAEATATDKLLLALAIEDVLMLGEGGVAYTTRAAIKTRLGF